MGATRWGTVLELGNRISEFNVIWRTTFAYSVRMLSAAHSRTAAFLSTNAARIEALGVKQRKVGAPKFLGRRWA